MICIHKYRVILLVLQSFQSSGYHIIRFSIILKNLISMVYLNLLFLLLITFLSVTTSLVINYGSYQIPYVLYCIVVIMTSSLLALIWWLGTRDHRLVDKDIHPLFIRGVMANLLLIPFVFAISIIVSFFDLNVAQYLWLVIAPLNIAVKRKYRH